MAVFVLANERDLVVFVVEFIVVSRAVGRAGFDDKNNESFVDEAFILGVMVFETKFGAKNANDVGCCCCGCGC